MGGNKAALLIGVSEYSEAGLKPLPSATEDIQAMQRVLTRSSEFAADQIRVLANPQKQEVEEAIYWLFADRQKDDLLLFYFSGHGIKDETGKLYFSLPTTRKDRNGLIKHTAVPANLLHENMNDSRSTCQVLVLDCCFSGAFAKGLTIKDDGSIDIPTNLGGKGRAIFTSSNSIEYSFQQEGLTLSVYTNFLVEGLEKGAADLDGDGLISADELHDYVSVKVKTAAPAMTPQFFPVEQGHRIYLGRSVKDDPVLQYRKVVEQKVKQGSFQAAKDRFSVPARRALDLLSRQLNLSSELIEEIEAQLLQPLREYQNKFQDYEQIFRETLEDENYPLSFITRLDLKDCQILLSLQDEDVQTIEAKVLSEKSLPQSPPSSNNYFFHLEQYGQEFLQAIQIEGFILREETRKRLRSLAKQFELVGSDVADIERKKLAELDLNGPHEEDITMIQDSSEDIVVVLPNNARNAAYFEKIEQYGQNFLQALRTEGFNLSEETRTHLRGFARQYELVGSDVADIERKMLIKLYLDTPRQS